MEYFKFREFLEAVLIRSGREIVPHDFKMVNDNALELEKEYAELINILDAELSEGEIIGLKKYINGSVNGSFTRIIKNFLWEYDKSIQEN